MDHFDEYQEDMLNFKDSERESVISYLEEIDTAKEVELMPSNRIDTPTRLVNYSNEFLGQKFRVKEDKLK